MQVIDFVPIGLSTSESGLANSSTSASTQAKRKNFHGPEQSKKVRRRYLQTLSDAMHSSCVYPVLCEC